MKKLLIVEEPESCETCPLRSYSNLMLVCTPMREAASDVECPLKPMPNKLDANDWHRMFGGTYEEREAKGLGWNACLEEIEKC